MNKRDAAEKIKDLNELTGAGLKVESIKNDEITLHGTFPADVLARIIDEIKATDSREGFLRAVLEGRFTEAEIQERAERYGFSAEKRYAALMIEQSKAGASATLLSEIFAGDGDNLIMPINDHSAIFIKELSGKKEKDMLNKTAESIVSTVNTELMEKVRVSYGRSVTGVAQIQESYLQAKLAMEVAGIFYTERYVISCDELGIGRLIAELPVSLCELFMDEICGEKKKFSLSDDELKMINSYFDRNLSLAETARDLYIHRNTLTYRIEKLQKKTGLDIRNFDDAVTLKIALMVDRYLEYKNANS